MHRNSISSGNLVEALQKPNYNSVTTISFYSKKISAEVETLFENLAAYRNLESLSIGPGVLSPRGYDLLVEHLPNLGKLATLTLPEADLFDCRISSFLTSNSRLDVTYYNPSSNRLAEPTGLDAGNDIPRELEI